MERATTKMGGYRPLQFMRSSARNVLSPALVAVFATCLVATAAVASPRPQNERDHAPTVKQRVMALPPHAMIRVRLHNQDIKGRVRIAMRNGFVLEIASDGKHRDEKISYDDVQSIQSNEGHGKGASFSIHLVIDGSSGDGVDVEIDH